MDFGNCYISPSCWVVKYLYWWLGLVDFGHLNIFTGGWDL